MVRNETVGVVSLECVDGDLHIVVDMEFIATDVKLVAAGVDSLVANVDEGFLMKPYVQFVLGCEHADWVAKMYLILMF